jgi:UDP-N-acetylglucosamine 2-epimerase (non-hydrolysing)
VIVQGDTVSTYAGALAGFLAGKKVFHVEAGLRSFDIKSPFPEEGFRTAISKISSMNFAPTELSKKNLRKEGVPSRSIKVVGNTGIDALHRVTSGDPKYGQNGAKASDETKARVVVTLHRRENWDYLSQEIFPAIETIANANKSVRFTYVLHPNPEISALAEEALGGLGNIELIRPLDYVEFAILLRDSAAIITDSGGLQEEGPSLGIPTFVLRDTTERPEAIKSGLLILCGNKLDQIIKTVKIPTHKSRKNTPFIGYGDGHAAKKIVEALDEF